MSCSELLSTLASVCRHTAQGSASICRDCRRSLRKRQSRRGEKLCGEPCEISHDTERPELQTAEKSSSGINPADWKSGPAARLSHRFSLVDRPLGSRSWIMKVLHLSPFWVKRGQFSLTSRGPHQHRCLLPAHCSASPAFQV